MSGGNGNTPQENLIHLRSKRVHAEPATLERSKCPSHPTKRAWPNPLEAIREAEARSEAAKMAIVAYKCDACEQYHLCKRANAHPGSVVEREALPERELSVVLGNKEARIKALAGLLNGRTEVTSAEIEDFLGVGIKTYGPMMRTLKWYNTRGRHARWVPNPTPATVEVRSTGVPPNFEVFKGKGMTKRNLHALDDSASRHPAAAQAGWRPMTKLDSIRHMPLGDLIDTLHAAGMEIRIQVREG